MRVRSSLLLFASASAIVGAAAGWLIPNGNATHLTFVSVGQGDCAVFQTDGKTILIDVGPPANGQALLAKALRKLQVDTIDLVLLSHPDLDHIGGLDALTHQFKVGQIAAPASFEKDEKMNQSLESMSVDPKSVLWLKGPLDAEVGSFNVHVETPDWREGEPDNEGSMFVRISDGKASATFSGDANMLTEIHMMRKSNWASEILKIGHHGSQFSTSDSWLAAVNPEFAIISCGRNNRYGHPHATVLERLGKTKAKVFRTDLQGDIEFDYDGESFRPESKL